MDDNLKGIAIALVGALALVPDTLLMRLSGLDAMQMIAWRGTLQALVLLSAWAVLSTGRRRDLSRLATRAGCAAMVAQSFNAAFFAFGIGHAPVAVVLVAIATVPLFASLMGAVFLTDRMEKATLSASLVVLAGIAIAVSGDVMREAGSPAVGAICGLAVALCLSGSFTLYRAQPELPVLPTVGCGAAISGLAAALFAGSLTTTTDGWLPAIWITGLVILPISFTSLNIASRYTVAANVSLLLLLETVLGPAAVWVGIGEPVGPRGLLGGAIVVATLAVYLWDQRRRTLARVCPALAPDSDGLAAPVRGPR